MKLLPKNAHVINGIHYSLKERGFWVDVENQKQFLDNISKKFSISKPSDWGKITWKDINSFGGKRLLDKHGGSLLNVFRKLYPETIWENEWFANSRIHERGFWRNTENHKQYLERLFISLNLKEPKDWGKITVKRLKLYGAGTLLKHYDFSIYKALKFNFPDVEWQVSWFPNVPKYSPSYWDSNLNQKKFILEIAEMYGISEPNDWQRVNLSLIKKNGGAGLLRKYNDSLMKALEAFSMAPLRKSYFRITSSQFRVNDFVNSFLLV